MKYGAVRKSCLEIACAEILYSLSKFSLQAFVCMLLLKQNKYYEKRSGTFTQTMLRN